MSVFDLNGRKALVAGGAGDLGRGMVRALAGNGVEVAVLDVTAGLEDWVDSLRQPGQAVVHGIRTDLTDRADLGRGFAIALHTLGTIDILVNAQGIQRRFPAEDFPLDVWDQVIEVNLTSVFAMCQLAGRVMLARRHGKIINIASMQSFTGGYTIPAYAASKAGVAQITKALANEWTGRGVTVNAIAPGYMDTKMTAEVKADPVRYERILARIPAGRWGQPEDVCGPLLFLASSASDYVSGVVLPVDGGMLGT
jgi:2-deoxy-D-gluconate 3-dehydrogenase